MYLCQVVITLYKNPFTLLIGSLVNSKECSLKNVSNANCEQSTPTTVWPFSANLLNSKSFNYGIWTHCTAVSTDTNAESHCYNSACLYNVYVSELNLQHYKVDIIDYIIADDTQMYLPCHRDDLQSAAAQLELCISEVGQWMATSRLKLNTDKTELIWTGSKASLLRQGRCLPALQLGQQLHSGKWPCSITGSNDLIRPQSWLTRRQWQLYRLLLVTAAPTRPALTGHGLGHNTGPRIRIVACRLL